MQKRAIPINEIDIYIDKKENRAKNRSLGNTSCDKFDGRQYVNRNFLMPLI